MRVALAQVNPTLGDFKNNAKKIIEFSERAKERRADIVVFPESALFGYHPMDLLERKSVVDAELRELKSLIKRLPKDILIIFGAFTKNPNKQGKPYYNSAIVVFNKKIKFQSNKQLLPTYGVFDDARHIEPGQIERGIFNFKGKNILITICEDIWAWPVPQSPYYQNPLLKIKKSKVDFVVNLSASPFYENKLALRRKVVSLTAKNFKSPMVYVNMVGAQDELIYDGASFAVNKSGQLLAQSAFFKEDLNVIDFTQKSSDHHFDNLDSESALREALTLGLRDFIFKTGLKHVHLGLSGGIDSAVVACLAVDALGSANVSGVWLPGPHSSDLSFNLAKALAKNLKIPLHTVELNSSYKSLVTALNDALGAQEFGLMHENLQARLRGMILMYYANVHSSLLLNTSNKSELAAGYGTLYGDLCGGLSPIGDLTKTQVYRLARYYNQQIEIIPAETITRAPTAELRPNQKDQDTLPPYSELDKSVELLVEKKLAAKSDSDTFLLKALLKSEFKRWQSPPILKVREHSFGVGRRMPIAHRAEY